jgi:hypothetical protein
MTRARDERGAVAIVTAAMLVVVLLAVAFVVDIGSLAFRRQTVRNATDSAALAGAALLPMDPNGAKAMATKYAISNDPTLTASTVDVTFRCLIGDANGDGLADLSDVPGVCDPGADGMSGFVCDRGMCMAPCVPSGGDICNAIVVGASESVDFRFASVAGITKGSTGLVVSGACSGLCSAAPKVPLDIGVIIDRTSSMSSSDLANAKSAALAMLGDFNPKYDHIALGVINRSSTTTQCTGGGYGRSITTTDFALNRGTWIGVPYPTGGLSSDYQLSNGALNNSSALVKTISCLQTSSFSTSQGQTDIGDPITAMASLLTTRGRAGVKKVMIVETDGEANLPVGSQPCGFAVQEARRAQAQGIEVYTIGFGIAGKRCFLDTTGAYVNALVTKVLADAATQPTTDSGCVSSENTDGDHFYCEPKSADLRTVFLRVASDITGRPRIVRLPY